MFFRRKPWLANYLTDHNLIKRPTSWWKKLLPVAIVVGVILLIVVVPLGVSGYQIYSKLVNLNKLAEVMIADVKAGKLTEVKNNLSAVEGDLIYIKAKAKLAGPILLWPSIGKTAKTADQMLSASIDLLQGYQQILGVFSDLTSSTDETQVITSFNSPEGKKKMLAAIVKNRSTLEEAKFKIKAAKMELAAINTNDLTGILKDKVIYVNNLLYEITDQSYVALPLFKYLPELAGYGIEKNYLILFQNNMELRPTGGFIGSYGLIKVKDGEIISITTDDIYNLDKYSKDILKVPAPWAMTAYNGQKYLFLRDANWSPDWPTDAEQILWLWDIERANAKLPPQKLDGIIAITPDFIANFLDLTGPITVDGVTFHKNNFAIELEQAVEFNYVDKGIPIEQRKAIIGDLTKEIMKRVMASSPTQLLALWGIMKDNIESKQIIAWLNDATLQDYFSNENWSGEVRAADSDYLYVVDANLAALKTDSVMKRSTSYALSVDANGDLTARAEITYQHAGKAVQALISKYRTYTRVYTPEGTWFTKIYTKDKTGVQNYDLQKNVELKSELGKRSAGVFLEVQPGETKTLVLEYKLPASVKTLYQNGLYKLLVQKQPGTTGHNLGIDLKFGQLITAYHADKLPVSFKGKNLLFNLDLNSDQEVTVKF